MRPRLYSSFNASGVNGYLGTLDSCTKCLATEARNGAYTLELTTTVNDICAEALESLKILEVKANPFDDPQCFEIEKTERTLDGRINVTSKHVKDFCFQYWTQGDLVTGDTVYTETGTPSEVWATIKSDYMAAADASALFFVFDSDMTSASDEKAFSLGLTKPESLGNILSGKQGSFVDTFGGELHFNNKYITLKRTRGRNTGYELRYGTNISDASQSESCEASYTHIFPYGEVLCLTSAGDVSRKINFFTDPVEISGHEAGIRRRIFPLDCTDFLEAYTVQEPNVRFDAVKAAMSAYASNYARYNVLGKRKVSIDVTLRSELDRMNNIGLCDTVKVLLTPFGSTTTAKVTEVVYNCLLERWEKITVGEKKTALSDIILNKKRYVK